MRKHKKRLLSGVLAALMILTAVPVNALELSTQTSEDPYSSVYVEEQSSDNSFSGETIDEITSQEVAAPSDATESSEYENVYVESEEPLLSQAPSISMNSEDGDIPDDMTEFKGYEDQEPVEGWQLGVVFFDSSVNNGKTPLKEIDWDASDGDYHNGTPRIITVQINYKNTSTIQDYPKGTLQINIPNLMYGYQESSGYKGEASAAFLNTSVDVGANYSQRVNYDWDFSTSSSGPSTKQRNFSFTNAVEIDEKTNFEGSIQIVYTITPRQCNGYIYQYQYAYNNSDSEAKPHIEGHDKFLDQHTHSYSKNLIASLNKMENNSWIKALDSNEISFDYTRTYLHEWEKKNYTVDKYAEKVTSMDGLGSNAADYTWVKYRFRITGKLFHNTTDPYPFIPATKLWLYDTFPESCVVYNSALSPISPVNDGDYKIEGTWYNFDDYGDTYIYVGYPKSVFNDENENLSLKNHVDLYVDFMDGETLYEDDAEVSLNLADFQFSYSGNLYGVDKAFNVDQHSGSSMPVYYQALTGEDTNLGTKGIFHSTITTTARYTGRLMDVRFGDDVLFITDENSEYRMLNDSEYYFSKISFPSSLSNGNGQPITAEKYDCELWVRKSNSFEYEKIEEFKNTSKSWTFTEQDHVAGYYFVIRNLAESIISAKSTCDVTINNASNIARAGTVYNFAFIQVYIDGVLQNEPDLSSYTNTTTKNFISTLDLEKYGTYMQRGQGKVDYKYFEIVDPICTLYAGKSASSTTQDATNECFTGSFTISARSNESWHYPFNYSSYELLNYASTVDDEDMCTGWELFDLLPLGMELTSTPEQILNTVSTHKYENRPAGYLQTYMISKDGKDYTQAEFLEILRSHQSIEVIENYKGTGRTLIHITIDLSDNPVLYVTTYTQQFTIAQYSYKYKITYDSVLEYGRVWNNNTYVKYFGKESVKDGDSSSNFRLTSSYTKDNGNIDIQESDINSNNNTDELMSYAKASTTINSIISTHQDVLKQVQTDKTAFTGSRADSSTGANYQYKLRVRTGRNNVSNLVIYDSLEEAYGKKKFWKGEFLGIDTSYAEGKKSWVYKPDDPESNDGGYVQRPTIVKTYYSENASPDYLYLQNGTLNPQWAEYNNETTDKTKVKSLAFEYWADDNGNLVKAIIPASSLTYVLINMKAPDDDSITTFARNMCYTQWQAVDDFGQPVYNITGIESNIVRVALPNTVETDEEPAAKLVFKKFIDGTDEAWEQLKLDKNDTYYFPITMTNTATGDVIRGMLTNKGELVFSNVPLGIYTITEADDNYFDFVSMIGEEEIEGITFDGTTLTVGEGIPDEAVYTIDVTNKLEPERFYEDKEEKPNYIAVILPEEVR